MPLVTEGKEAVATNDGVIRDLQVKLDVLR